jgi:hypothetical protein
MNIPPLFVALGEKTGEPTVRSMNGCSVARAGLKWSGDFTNPKEQIEAGAVKPSL